MEVEKGWGSVDKSKIDKSRKGDEIIMEPEEKKKTEISFYVDAETLEKVNRICNSSGQSIDEVVEELLWKGLSQDKLKGTFLDTVTNLHESIEDNADFRMALKDEVEKFVKSIFTDATESVNRITESVNRINVQMSVMKEASGKNSAADCRKTGA